MRVAARAIARERDRSRSAVWMVSNSVAPSDQGRARSARSASARTPSQHNAGASLCARPLIEEVQQLARYARLELTDEPAAAPAAEASAAESSAADRLGLTPREIDVLILVAEGKTNVQIGKALFISDKTASVHVSHILAKLGASNRVEAAGIAHRLGLVEPPS